MSHPKELQAASGLFIWAALQDGSSASYARKCMVFYVYMYHINSVLAKPSNKAAIFLYCWRHPQGKYYI